MSQSAKLRAQWARVSVDHLVIAAALLFSALACGDDSSSPPDTPAAGGGRGAPPADSGMDAAVKRHTMAPAKDGGARDSGMKRDSALEGGMSRDAEQEAGPMCDPALCPVTSTAIDYGRFRQLEQKPCCVQYDSLDHSSHNDYVGTCGFIVPGYASPDTCEPLLDGELDESCLDTLVNGELIQGCRRPDGQCGHLTPGWGCHRMFRSDWRVRGNEIAKYLNPFVCTLDEDPCTSSDECCDHPSYSSLCFLPDSLAQPADADVPVGLCLDTFRYTDYGAGQILPPLPL